MYHDDYSDVFAGENVDLTNSSIAFKTLNTFTFKNRWNAELGFFYNSSDLEGLTITQPVYSLEAGIGKRFYNDRLTIKLSGTDILMTEQYTTSTVYQNINILDKRFEDYVRKVIIGIIWKFGKSEYEREENNNAKAIGKSKTGT